MKKALISVKALSWLACFIALFFPFYVTTPRVENNIVSLNDQTGFLAAFGVSWHSQGTPHDFSCYSPLLTIALLLFVFSLATDFLSLAWEKKEKNPILFLVLSLVFKIASTALFFTFPFYADSASEIGVASSCVLFGILLVLSGIATTIWESILHRKGHL